MSLAIRALERQDLSDWLVLWDANNDGQRNQIVTETTWERLNDPACPVHGLCAVENGKIAAILHYILHFTTGSLQPVAYVQDVFVLPSHRRRGLAKALLTEVAALREHKGWGRLYWLAETKNEAAQALYKTLGVRLDFTLHVWPLKKI